jgi:hypothetical protein
MFDSNLLFNDGTTTNAVTTNGDSTALNVAKTAEKGVTVEIAAITVSGTSPTLDVIVQESDNDSSYNNLVTFAQITGTGRWQRKVQSKKAYLRLDYTVGGTSPSFKVQAGIVSGPITDQIE